VILAAGAVQGPRASAQAGQQPVFRSGVELIAVDATIVDRNGYPITGVKPEQFEVEIDGKPRRVVSAEFLEFAPRDKPAAAAARPAAPAPPPAARPLFSSNRDAAAPAGAQGRLIYIAVDQGSFRPAGAWGAMEAARRFIDRLQPSDRIGLIGFPPPGPVVPASRDHSIARNATSQIVGSATPFRMGGIDKNLGLAEAIDIHAQDAYTIERVLARECGYLRTRNEREVCENDVRMTAISIGRNAEVQANRSLAGIDGVIAGLSRIRERKVLVLVSAGLPVADRIGMDLQLTSQVVGLGRAAAATNLSLFVLHIDSGFLDAFSPSEQMMSDTLFRDLGMMSTGLETIAGASGGSLARVAAGADFAFDRVLRETAASYLLAVEPAEGDRDGKPHRISVKVRIPNAEVRSRKEFIMPRADAKPASAEDALMAVFRSDTPRTDLPIRVSTHSLAAAPGGGYRVLVSADIGDTHTGPAEMQLLYTFIEASGQTLPAVSLKTMLRPRVGGPPGAVSYTSQSALDPGTYTLRMTAIDKNGRIGTVDHPVTVGLTRSDTVRLSDLVLLEPRPAASADLDVITDGRARGSAVDAYLEVAPAAASAAVTDVTFGIADRADAEPLVSAAAQLSRDPKAGHWSAGGRLSLALIPPGEYVATAVVVADGRTLGRVTRPITVEARTAAAASPGAGAAAAPRVSFAVGESGSLAKPFSPRDVLGNDALEYFLGRLRAASPEAASDPSAAAASAALLGGRFDQASASLVPADPKRLSTAFLKGLALLGKGDSVAASDRFREAIDIAPDFLPAAFYLGACYAANRNDREAAAAWQMALISESDAPIIYDVLGDALLRLQDADEAADLLAEAHGKWPGDERFVTRLAASEAMRRRPREAMVLLDGHIVLNPKDADALLLALRLLYDARAEGGRITSADDDIALARRYAELYKAAGGANQALVERWVRYIAER
jgi:VWFA-related protein